MKSVAVVGGGISGLAAAYFLSRRYRVFLFERDARLGGHTNTVIVRGPDGEVALDTGFLVHNDRTYPNLVRLFTELGVATHDSDMSFGVSCRQSGFGYSSRGASGFFARRRHLVSPSHYALLAEIVRFNREAPRLLAAGEVDAWTLGEFLETRRFSKRFRSLYLYPMASAIWSSSLGSIESFPASTFVRFFDNHGLLGLTSQPTWKVLTGGSHRYIPALTAPLGDGVTCGAGLERVRRGADGVTLTFSSRPPMVVDDVVLACHGDQVLPLLSDPTPAETAVFGAFRTTTNVAWLHTDASVLPARRAARASWNYLLNGDGSAPPGVTYDLNRLQGLGTREQYCVTLNPNVRIDDDRVLGRFVYRHPLFTLDAIRAQARWSDVSGVDRTHYCGAYWGFGFHEDGLNSAIRVASSLGAGW